MTQMCSILWLRNIPLYVCVCGCVYCVYIYIYIYIYIYTPQLLYPFICWWTSSLPPCSTIVNCAAVNIGVHVTFTILVSQRYKPSSEITGSYAGFIPHFLRNLHLSFIVAVSVYIPTNSTEGSLFSTPSPAFNVWRLLAILTGVRW